MVHRHETGRAFVTKCRYCGAEVFYWECAVCRARAFFSYPIYGRLVRHYCSPINKDTGPKVDTTIPEIGALLFKCPVCGKVFRSINAVENHVKNKIRDDDLHSGFFEKISPDTLNDKEGGNNHGNGNISIYKMGSAVQKTADSGYKIGPYGVKLKIRKKK